MAWQMPVHREPTSLELAVEHSHQRLQELLSQVINSNEMLVNWLDHPHRQPLCLFTIVIVVSTIWLAHSHIATWRALRSEAAHIAAQSVPQEVPNSNHNAHASSSRRSTANAGSPPETPAPRKSTPDMNGSPSLICNHIPFGIGKHIDGRTGRVSTPGYQTPFVNDSNRRKFSGLAKNAPVSYDTLQRNRLLDAEGTAIKKHGSASLAQEEEEWMPVYDSPTKSWGDVKRSANGPKKVQGQAEGICSRWLDGRSDVRVQQFSAVTGKWMAS